jgi:hypothetical protein
MFSKQEEDMVAYSETCSCNPKNGGSGICGCVMANTLVPNPKKYGSSKINTPYEPFTMTGTTINEAIRYILDDIKPNVVKPPKPINPYQGTIRIFLAGSIEMGVAEDWQTKIIDNISKHFDLPEITFINPRRESWDSSWEQSIENPQFYQQVNWELNGLDQADIIVMNFLPDTKSPISLLELGLYASSGKLIVCCPEGFWRKGNVDIVCEKYGIKTVDTIDELTNYIINKLSK